MIEKLKPLEILKENSLDDIFVRSHELFKNTIARKDRPKLGDKEIFVPLVWIETKAEIFWHSSSIEPKSRLDIKPCNNDISSSLCDGNCITSKDMVIMKNGEERAKCIFRAVRIGWIREMIEMYNSGDHRVFYWEKVNSDKRNRLYLRYIEDEIDYMVVFEEKSEKRVRLITAYPVFFISAKRDYDKDFQNYWKNIKKLKTGNRIAKTGFSF
jgi:hypothetical protein